MFLCQPCGGLRSCVFQQPPLLMFFLCLVTLAVTFLSLGAYVKTHPVRNADVTQDWDSLLQALGLLQFCPQGNTTGRVTPLLLAGSPLNVSGLHPGGLASTSVLVGLSLRPWDPVTNTSGLRLSVSSAQLGLRGEGTGADLFVTVSPVRSAGGCGDTDCSTKYCVTVTAPVSLLPQARRIGCCVLSACCTQVCVCSPSGVSCACSALSASVTPKRRGPRCSCDRTGQGGRGGAMRPVYGHCGT
ncbi:transmembrane protein 248-like [Ascaphus truei]|uniref:transmembrane protein 248-like n=1 Tax=Ascaphus truei TaxID=8439 RepID=UPI003F598E1E